MNRPDEEEIVRRWIENTPGLERSPQILGKQAIFVYSRGNRHAGVGHGPVAAETGAPRTWAATPGPAQYHAVQRGCGNGG